METLYEFIKEHSDGKGEDMMWKSTAIISDAVEKNFTKDAKKKLLDDLYGLMSGGHYNESMADCDVEKMFYVDESGVEHYGPYLTKPEVKALYDKVKTTIPDYNEWDWYVTLHMIVSDNHNLINDWFPGETATEHVERYVKMAVNWLHDQDRPCTNRIWTYMH